MSFGEWLPTRMRESLFRIEIDVFKMATACNVCTIAGLVRSHQYTQVAVGCAVALCPNQGLEFV